MPLEGKVRHLYNQFGQRKPMGEPATDAREPHYFLHRTFLNEQDLLIIFNTKRCRYQCHFCNLPLKSSTSWISGDDILAQFEYVLDELKHSLSVLDRLTISNEGSVLDAETFPTEVLLTIAKCAHELRRVRTIVLETRLEFMDPKVVRQIREADPRAVVDILTGFETQDPHIRDEILGKRESLDTFLAGLDRVAECGAELTAFVLFKPSPTMTDDEAFKEAETSIDYLVDLCLRRDIPLTIRLNPMYAARRSKWAKIACVTPEYKPPRLTDVMKLAAKKRQEGSRVYIGLSTEGLDEPWGNYMCREDYSRGLFKQAILFNSWRLSHFRGLDYYGYNESQPPLGGRRCNL